MLGTTSAVADLTSLTPYELARLADCSAPDSTDTAGARLLRRVASDLQELVTWGVSDSGDTLAAVLERIDATGGLHEIADGTVPVYTHDVWAAFGDLGAYAEDPHELGTDPDRGMTGLACTCLYLIADRLVRALAGTLTDGTLS